MLGGVGRGGVGRAASGMCIGSGGMLAWHGQGTGRARAGHDQHRYLKYVFVGAGQGGCCRGARCGAHAAVGPSRKGGMSSEAIQSFDQKKACFFPFSDKDEDDNNVW